MEAMQSLSVHTAAVPCGFWLHWLTSQARYVRVLIPRRAMRASCESPWRVSAKHRISGACFPLTTPFRTCFSPCEMARTANVQKLIGCLYTLRDSSILTCRFHGTGHLSAKRCFLRTCLPRTAPFRAMLLTLRGGPQCLDPRAHGVPVHLTVSYIPRLCFTAQTCISPGLTTF